MIEAAGFVNVKIHDVFWRKQAVTEYLTVELTFIVQTETLHYFPHSLVNGK